MSPSIPAVSDRIRKSPVEIFQDVRKTFFDSLSDQERQSFESFPDAKSMLRKAEEVVLSSPVHQSKLKACLVQVNDLSNRLSPYFEILNIFVSSHPEFAALAWGAIRLVFQLGKNYVMFLEKICDMFAQMGRVLPAYEEYIERLVSGARQRDEEMSTRILHALAFIYSDLVHFCFDACKIFTRRKLVFGLKWPLATSLLWRPFDDRFDSILGRFKEHKELMDLEMRVDSHAKVIKVAEKLDAMLWSAESQAKDLEEADRRQQQLTIERRLNRLKDWINPPSWLCLYENAQGRRTPKTADWFLTNSTVKSWLQKIGQTAKSPHCNILSIQGKPGYGKTTLCTALADYLTAISTTSGSESDTYHAVFFYFDKQRGDSSLSSVAFRAILTQILQIHGGSKQGIDVASILWSQSQSGQRVASGNEVKELLRLILSHTKQLVLLLDGIDECADQRDLFKSLKELGFTSPNYSIAFFGRPTVQLPRTISPKALEMLLDNSQNLKDIRRFLRPRIQELVDDGILPETLNAEDTVMKISNRANGMFLWVTLLVEYLASPALTIRQRRNTIENLNRLEGLDALYGVILQSLSILYAGEARENVQQLFQWVVCSFRPLHLSELKCAMATPRDRKMEQDDDFRDFRRSLSCMSGALLELDVDNKVRFIHLSALEYFGGLDSPVGLSTPSSQRLTFVPLSGHIAYLYCATVCLSYMYYTIPAEPLGGSAQIAPDKSVQSKRYPLLEYSSEYWSKHMLKAITTIDIQNAKLEVGPLRHLLDLAKSFLSNKDTVTTWIEASWMFGRRPNIVNGEEQMRKVLTTMTLPLMDAGLVESFQHALKSLGKLSEDLTRLNQAWGKVLRQTPNEIWEPSISAFLKSKFWVNIGGSKLTPLESSQSGQQLYVCVKSQVSADGTEVGIIKVQPPQIRAVNGRTSESSSDRQVPTEEPIWRVRYELWSLVSRSMIVGSSFYIPGSMVPFSYMYKGNDAVEPMETLEFLFPTSLSSNLRHASFLNIAGSLVRVEPNAADEQTRDMRARLKMQLQVVDISLRTETASCGSFNFDWSRFHSGFSTLTSESGEFLLVLHVLPADDSRQIIKIDDITRANIWFVRIYRNASFNSGRGPCYSLVSTIAFKPDQISQIKDRPFTFHPELPLLVFVSGRTVWIERADQEFGVCILAMNTPKLKPKPTDVLNDPPSWMEWQGTGGVTVIWNFGYKASKPVCIGSLMRDVKFSNDGAKVYGTVGSKEAMIGLPFKELGVDEQTQNCPTNTDVVISSQQLSVYSKSALMSLSNGPSPATQQSNSLIFSRDNEGRVVVTDLQQSVGEGALILRTLREDQLVTHESLTRLPDWVDRETEATLLDPGRARGDESDEVVCVVLNRAARPFQTFRSNGPHFVPAILEREQQTIPRLIGRRGAMLEGEAGMPRRITMGD